MAALPPYASTGQRIWHWTYLAICAAILFFLIMPILVIIPLSFNAENFFTFTKGMLALDPDAYSLKHYRDFFTSNDWQQALWNSLVNRPAEDLSSLDLSARAELHSASRILR